MECSTNQSTADRLLWAYKTAVLMKGREYDPNVKDFGEAVQAMPAEVFETMRRAYADQVDELGEDE